MSFSLKSSPHSCKVYFNPLLLSILFLVQLDLSIPLIILKRSSRSKSSKLPTLFPLYCKHSSLSHQFPPTQVPATPLFYCIMSSPSLCVYSPLFPNFSWGLYYWGILFFVVPVFRWYCFICIDTVYTLVCTVNFICVIHQLLLFSVLNFIHLLLYSVHLLFLTIHLCFLHFGFAIWCPLSTWIKYQ